MPTAVTHLGTEQLTASSVQLQFPIWVNRLHQVPGDTSKSKGAKTGMVVPTGRGGPLQLPMLHTSQLMLPLVCAGLHQSDSPCATSAHRLREGHLGEGAGVQGSCVHAAGHSCPRGTAHKQEAAGSGHRLWFIGFSLEAPTIKGGMKGALSNASRAHADRAGPPSACATAHS